MHPADEVLGGLQAVFKSLDDVSGFLAVLVAVVTSIAAFRQLRVWREETAGKTNYQVALNYRRSLFQLHDAIVDLRYPVVRPNEVNKDCDEKHEPTPEPGSSQDEWDAYGDRQCVNDLENELKRKRWLINLRWAEMMTKYRVFQDQLLEARVHGIREDRFCVELDVFLNKVSGMFRLRFAEMQDNVWDAREALKPEKEKRVTPPLRIADSERALLQQVGRLPPEEWSTEKSEILDVDQLEIDLKAEIDRLDAPVRQYMLEHR
ncbi:MAG: hypothetical protein U5S82_17155 [Gammaproteobacteria bacterium]|nr:hypothetical protein [Gammaproteobacteria bacterium]